MNRIPERDQAHRVWLQYRQLPHHPKKNNFLIFKCTFDRVNYGLYDLDPDELS